ncbi:MAG: hypothetical protein ACJAY8_000772 [Sphingobacteriales bacterium]
MKIQIQPNEANNRGLGAATLALLDANFVLLDCASSNDQVSTAILNHQTVMDSWYYVAVDKTHDTDVDGEFELCIQHKGELNEGVSSLRNLMNSEGQPATMGVYSMLGSNMGTYTFSDFSEMYFGHGFASNIYIVNVLFPSGNSQTFKWNNVSP